MRRYRCAARIRRARRSPSRKPRAGIGRRRARFRSSACSCGMHSGGCVIVGGGPAGAVTALQLARAGVNVTVVERARFPRRKGGGEYLRPGPVRAIDGLGLGERVRARAAVLRGVRLVTREFERILPFAEPALAIDRATFDAELLAAAREAGAALVHGRAEDVVTKDGRARG